MWPKILSKISVFLLLVMVINVSGADTTIDPLGSTIPAESFNTEKDVALETMTLLEDELPITTEKPAEIENTTESDDNSVDITSTESSGNGDTSTEAITESTTTKIECVCDCLDNGNHVILGCSTTLPENVETVATESSESQTDKTIVAETATSTDSIISETTNQLNAVPDTTTQKAGEPQTTTVAAPICSAPGVQAHELDCQQYYDCSLEGSEDGNFHLLTKSCPDKQAFNTELNRCSRDISSCSSLPIQCLVKGGVADPSSNSSYYLCEPRLIGVGFRIFHIDCTSSEIFYPELGKCFVDFNNMPTQGFPLFNWNQIRDIDIVKAELKLLKEQDKLTLKLEKERIKAEEKLLKEIEKEAKKKAKEEEKANRDKAKQEAATIVCVQEGNIASEISDNIYYACITKKSKLKAIAMECSFGAKFNPEAGSCISSLTGENVSASEEDD